MSKFWSAPVSRKLLAAVCLIALLVSLIPPLALSFYNHASYDDLGYSIRTQDRWRDTGSFWRTVEAAAENTASIRYTWLGTFFSCFLASALAASFFSAVFFSMRSLCAARDLSITAKNDALPPSFSSIP